MIPHDDHDTIKDYDDSRKNEEMDIVDIYDRTDTAIITVTKNLYRMEQIRTKNNNTIYMIESWFILLYYRVYSIFIKHSLPEFIYSFYCGLMVCNY